MAPQESTKPPVEPTAPPTPPEPTKASKKIIEFTGFSLTTRIISKEDLLRVGAEESALEGFKTLTWSPETGHVADVTDVDETIIALLVRDPELSLVGDKTGA